MSEKYFNSPEHKRIVSEERQYNMPRLMQLKNQMDSGKIKNKELFINNPLWEYGYVQCIGIECSIKSNSTSYTCPLSQEQCWWVDAHKWRLENEKEVRGRLSFMRKYSDI